MATNMPRWLSEASTAVTDATNAVQAQNEISDLTEARAELARQLCEFRRLAQADALGRGTWWLGQTAEPDVFRELKKASSFPQARVLNSLQRRLDSFARTVNTRMVLSWGEYSARRTGNVTELQMLAGTLSGIEGVALLAANLLEILGQLGRIQTQAPTRESLTLLDRAEKGLADLEAALQPNAVREFLSAVARGGAPLNLLTDEVRTWLTANRAELCFKIAAGAPEKS